VVSRNLESNSFVKNRSRQGGEINQALYAHMNNKRKMKKKKTDPGLCAFPSPDMSSLRKIRNLVFYFLDG
jgi:hypothetical protein